MIKLLLATNNNHKLKEIRAIFGLEDFVVIGPAALGINLEVEENGSDYQENALIKARAYRKYCTYPIVADDSGLEIAAWSNKPGIHSARFLSEAKNYYEKNQIILQRLADIKERTAEFVSVAAVVLPDGKEAVFCSRLKGTIALTIRGEGGFGFDPIFQLTDCRCMAELSAEEKNRVSHRAMAFNQMKEFLLDYEN